MALSDAAFSGFMGQLVTALTVTGAFAAIRRRQVNVLREEEFPLLAVWVEGDAEDGQGGSDGEFPYETEYSVLVAARLAEGDAQDAVLGRLMKAVRDAVHAMAITNVEFRVGRWDGDNNTAEDEGDKVWADCAVTLSHCRPRGDY